MCYGRTSISSLYSLAPIAVETEACLLTVIMDITERKAAEQKLVHLSTHDALSGLYNRAFFDEEMTRWQSSREFPISIVMADVDDLKTVNDSHGHAAGDEHLKHAARAFKTAFRAEDVVARIGGDESAAILPNTNSPRVAEIVERIKANIMALNSYTDRPHLSLSLGAVTAGKGESLIQALKEADERMYREKVLNPDHRSSKNNATIEGRGLP